MEEFALLPFTHWHWWALGLALLALELAAPGVFFLWLGLGAWLTGAVLYLVPDLGWKGQLLVFSGSSACFVGAFWYWRRRHPVETDEPALNRRAQRYVGAVAVVEEAIRNGVGAVRIEDTRWRAVGPDAPRGSRVRVTGVEGNTLQVVPLEKA